MAARFVPLSHLFSFSSFVVFLLGYRVYFSSGGHTVFLFLLLLLLYTSAVSKLHQHRCLFKFARLLLLYIHKAFVRWGHFFTVQGQPSGNCRRTFCFEFWHDKSLFFLAEGDVLLGQEVMVPVLCLRTQASQQTLQLLSDFRVMVNDRQRVGKRREVGWSNPVVRRVGYFSLICLYLFPELQISLNSGVWTVWRNTAWPLHLMFLSFETWWFHLTSSVQTSSSEAL